jgi:hypothetical protein
LRASASGTRASSRHAEHTYWNNRWPSAAEPLHPPHTRDTASCFASRGRPLAPPHHRHCDVCPVRPSDRTRDRCLRAPVPFGQSTLIGVSACIRASHLGYGVVVERGPVVGTPTLALAVVGLWTCSLLVLCMM